MIAVLSVIFLSIIFVIIDLIPLYQNEEWVSFFLSVSLLVVALILAVLIELKI